MSFEYVMDQPVQVTIVYGHSTMVDVFSNSRLIDHFLSKAKLSQSVHTWRGYAFDLKVFFQTLSLPLDRVDRQACLRFMELQEQAGRSHLTINRRLAAVSSLFTELNCICSIQNGFLVIPLRLSNEGKKHEDAIRVCTTDSLSACLISLQKRTSRRSSRSFPLGGTAL
jgi:hypothetical protein